MNDTKYSPATSKTEELMDGSFRSAMSYIMSTEQSKKPCGARHSGPFMV